MSVSGKEICIPVQFSSKVFVFHPKSKLFLHQPGSPVMLVFRHQNYIFGVNIHHLGSHLYWKGNNIIKYFWLPERINVVVPVLGQHIKIYQIIKTQLRSGKWRICFYAGCFIIRNFFFYRFYYFIFHYFFLQVE